jgi:hypothetical protein
MQEYLPMVGLGIALVVALILLGVMPLSAPAILGFLPFIVMAAAALILLVIFVIYKVGTEVTVELLLTAGTIWMIVIAVMLFVGFACANISVREGFETSPSDELIALEKQVCTLIAASNKSVSNDVGQAGVDDPTVLATAIAKAHGPEPITECALTPAQMEERISRMENTLKSFTGPQLQKTYDASVPCTERFATNIAARLQAIKSTVEQQTAKLLMPIQKKEADLKAGILSDCEKKKGAKAAVVPSSGSGSGSGSGS